MFSRISLALPMNANVLVLRAPVVADFAAVVRCSPLFACRVAATPKLKRVGQVHLEDARVDDRLARKHVQFRMISAI